MASIPTKNTVPSENYDDLRFNAGKLDEFVTSNKNEYQDRLGITHLTAKGLQNSVAGALLPANNLSDVASKDSSLSNLGGTTTGIAVFKSDSASAARSAISAASSGANNDIKSLTGLTTALSTSQGGTGNTAGRSASATKLDVARGIRTSLSSTTAVNFDGTADITPGVTGVLPIANGGRGQSDVSYVRAEDSTSVAISPTSFIKLSPTEVADLKNEYSGGTFTATNAGYYHIVGSARMEALTSATAFILVKIDSATAPTNAAVPGQSSTQYGYQSSQIAQVSCIIPMAAGQSVSLYVYHNDSAAKNCLIKSLQAIRVA